MPVVLSLTTLAWLMFWAYQSLDMWLRYRSCLRVAGRFLRCDPGALAWQEPLIVALLPAALLGVGWALRRIVRHLRASASVRSGQAPAPR